MTNTLGILKRPQQLAELKEGQSVTVLLFPKQLGGEAPAENQYRQYMRVGGKLLSWAAKDMGSVDFAEVFPSTVTVNDIPAGEADYDKFLVSHGGMLKYRTAAQMLEDLGIGEGSEAGHIHDVRYYTETEIGAMPLVDYSGTPTAGHIPYFTDADTITMDENQLFWDAANNRLGIGTVVPGVVVEIQSSSPILRLRDTGATANATAAFVEFGGTDDAAWSRTGYVGDGSSGNTDIYLQATVGDLHLGDSSGISVLNLKDGSVGIGTIPGDKLHVVDTRTSHGSAAFWVQQTGASPGTAYGMVIEKTGASQTNVGGYFSATGATNNYGLIVSNGRVGIGTTAPDYIIDVAPDTNAGARFGRTVIGYGVYSDYAWFSHMDRVSAGNYALIQNAAGETYLNCSAGQTIRLAINNVAKVYLDSAGQIGVGAAISAPLHLLHVAGIIAARAVSTYGYISLTPGSSVQSGYLSIYKSGPTRIGYIGYDNTDVKWVLENGADLWISGGNVGIGEPAPDKLLTLKDEGDAGSKTFSSGWTAGGGVGWNLDYVSSLYKAEIDDLVVRGALSVYELIINQINAVNGSMIISAARGKVASVTGSPATEVVTMEDPENNGYTTFAANDIVMIQRVDLNAAYTVVKRIVRKVASATGAAVTMSAAAGAPADTGSITPGDCVVVIGNLNNTARDASIYMSATDSNNPFIRMNDAVTSWATWTGTAKTRVALGNLNGVYGYTAEIYGFAAGEYVASADKQYISVDPTNGLRIMQYQGSWKTMLVASADLLQVGATADKLKYVPSTNILTLGGWTVGTSTLVNLTANVGVKLDATNQKLQIGDLNEQHIDLLGVNGTLTWYRRTGVNTSTEAIKIDDDLYVHLSVNEPGIKITAKRVGGFYGVYMGNGLILRDTDLNAPLAEIESSDRGSLELSYASASTTVQFFLADYVGGATVLQLRDLPSTTGTDLIISGVRVYKKTSSSRYKKNVRALEIPSTLLYKVNPVTFDWRANSLTGHGLIAEELSALHKDLAHYDSKGRPESVNSELLMAMTIAELKKLRVNEDGLNIRVDELESQKLHARIVDLEAEVTTLKTQLAPPLGGTSPAGSGAIA